MPTINPAAWMDLIKGSTLLSELSIPGTHNSGSINPASQADRLTTQNRTIAEQLGDGIRFLDIRVGYTNNAFALYHEDVSVGLTFQSVLDTCKTFLANHPREAIIMSVKLEDDAPTTGNTADPVTGKVKTFQERFDAYAASLKNANGDEIFYQGSTIPTLHTVRGMIVLFRRFALDAGTAAAGHGINAFARFQHDATFTITGQADLEIQDQFAQSGANTRTRAQKFAAIKELLDGASGPAGKADTLYVNFTSAAGIVKNAFDNDFPQPVAADINPMVEDYFEEDAHKHGRFGIVVMDFETAARSRLVIRTNLRTDAGFWTVEQNGIVTAFGSAREFPITASPQAVSAIAATPSGLGYYLVTRDKQIYAFGDAQQQGDGGPDAQAVSIAAKPSTTKPAGTGYWVLYSNGKVRAFNANNQGQIEEDTNLEPVSIVATPDGRGYWILASNGRIHNFGNAVHFGDRRDADQANTSMTRTPNGGGYWLLASSGAVHAFGNAVDCGQEKKPDAVATGIAATRDGQGYWVLYSNGDVSNFGSAPYIGRVRHTEQAVGIAADLGTPA
jgi:1-phosphatidylinositol phosphodiesterase